jgi:dipeptidyl aminopeptidase/acylaminoacyl peptidase
LIFFQGAEDRIVPPNQTELMVAALKARGFPVGYFLFDGEQHGFPKSGEHPTSPRCGTLFLRHADPAHWTALLMAAER